MTTSRARRDNRGATRNGRPSPVLLVILALVVVAGIGKLALGSLTGGGTIHSFGTIAVPRALVKKTGTVPASSGGSQVLVSRPSRDPFAPPAGFSR